MRRASSHGGIMVETALLIPLFLAGVLFFMWVGTVFSAKSGFTSALSMALRLAITHGDESLVGGHLIQDIEDYAGDGDDPSPRMVQMLSQKVDWLTEADPYYANVTVGTVFNTPPGRSGLQGVPEGYTYAMVYLYESMKQSIGSSIRYPCDPEDVSDTDPEDGAGCVSCVFLNPDTGDSTPYTGGKPPTNTIGLECKFQPAHFILGPILKMLKLVTGSGSTGRILITRRIMYSGS